MKSMKKLLALLLVAAMCLTLLAACSSSGDQPGSDTQSDVNGNATNNETSGVEDESEPEFEDEEIVIYMMVTNAMEDEDAVEDAINAISAERYGITVDLHCFNMADYSTQLSLAITGNEQVDLACMTPIPGSTFASVTSTGQAMDISGMLDEYCPDILEMMGDYMDSFKIGDAVYGIPVARQKASNAYFRYRSDLADELGITDAIENAASFDDLDAVFEVVHAQSDVFPLAAGRGLSGNIQGSWDPNSFSIEAYDNLGDTLRLVYGDENGNAQCVLDSEGYLYMVKKFADWWNAGYVWADTLTQTELTGTQLIDNGTGFAEFLPTELGQDINGYSAFAANHPVTYKKIGAGMLTTSAFTMWSNFVPASARAPEAALAFLNALYTDSELMDTLIFGVEGQNYVRNDDGTASYPEGTDGETCGFHNSDWMMGNSFIMTPWDSQGADFRAAALEDFKNSAVSHYLGFALDTSEMADLIAGLSSVYEEYGYGILTGLYTESYMADFHDKLESAGLNEYLDGIQAQLDAWAGK